MEEVAGYVCIISRHIEEAFTWMRGSPDNDALWQYASESWKILNPQDQKMILEKAVGSILLAGELSIPEENIQVLTT